MRPSCTSCGRKHLAQALVLMSEVPRGYPEHAWIAIGHMAEAEDELVKDYPEMANQIRDERVKYMESVERGGELYSVPIMDLIKALTDLDGDPQTEIEIPDE